MTDRHRGEKKTTLQGLRRFLFDNVASYDELETLLALQRQPDAVLTIEGVASLLELPAEACQPALENLVARGLLILCEDGFRYAPANEALATAAEQLQHSYREDRFVIVQLMTTNAMDRVREAALHKLGGALQLKHAKKRADQNGDQ